MLSMIDVTKEGDFCLATSYVRSTFGLDNEIEEERGKMTFEMSSLPLFTLGQ